MPDGSRICYIDVILQKVRKSDASRRFGENVLMCNQEVLKI